MERSTVANRCNLSLIEDYYQRWQNDPTSVDESWRIFFEGYELGRRARRRPAAGRRPRRGPRPGGRDAVDRRLPRVRPLPGRPRPAQARARGAQSHELLEPAAFGLTEADLDRVFYNQLSRRAVIARCAS